MPEYIATPVNLDGLDIRMCLTLINARMKELEEFKAQHGEESIPATLANEQLAQYRITRKKLNAALAELKEVKAENDKAFYARLKANRKSPASSKR